MILEFDTGGSPSLFASGLDVSAIVAEVPEPGTWGLVVLGCGVFLIASRLRRGCTSCNLVRERERWRRGCSLGIVPGQKQRGANEEENDGGGSDPFPESEVP